MVAKFPKSSASALCHFLPATANAFSHPPKAPPCDAFPRNLIVAIPNGGRAIKLRLRPHLFHHQLTAAHRAHQPVIAGKHSPTNSAAPLAPSLAQLAAAEPRRRRERLPHSLPAHLALSSPSSTPSQPPPPHQLPVVAPAPAPTPIVASRRIP